MKFEWNRKYSTIAVYSFLVFVLCTLFFAFILKIRSVTGLATEIMRLLAPFIYGFAMAYILNPVLRTIEQGIFPRVFGDKVKPKTRRGLAIIATYVFAFACIGVFFWIVIPQIITSISSIVARIPAYVVQANELLNVLLEQLAANTLPTEFVATLDQVITDTFNTAVKIIGETVPFLIGMTMKLSTSIMNFILGVIVSVYMFMSKEKFFAQIKKALYAMFNKTTVDHVISLTHESHMIFSGFISGKILDSFIIGVLCFGCLTVLNMPYAMLVSVIVGVTNVIPYFGPFIGAVPGFFIILMVSPMKALLFLLFIFVLQQFDGNILGPKILGESTGLSAFWVVFSILLFGGLFGFIGMFIGVPVFAVIYSVIRKFIENRLHAKGMPTDTESYASDKHNLIG